MNSEEGITYSYMQAAQGWSEVLLTQFKKEYREKGPSEFDYQIRYLSELAEHYLQMGAAELLVDDAFAWVALLKVHLN